MWRSRWRIQELADETATYGVVIDRGDPVLEVESRGSATLIWRPVTVAEHADPWIAWRWRILSSNLPAHRDTRLRTGDDYAARVFVLFGDGEDAVASPGEDPLGSASRALCYVWADGEPMGNLYRSPYADRVVTIVLQTGPPTADGWARERRDLAADFRTAFGEPLPPVTAVALMADTDDTGSRVTVRFDDVELRFSSP